MARLDTERPKPQPIITEMRLLEIIESEIALAGLVGKAHVDTSSNIQYNVSLGGLVTSFGFDALYRQGNTPESFTGWAKFKVNNLKRRWTDMDRSRRTTMVVMADKEVEPNPGPEVFVKRKPGRPPMNENQKAEAREKARERMAKARAAKKAKQKVEA